MTTRLSIPLAVRGRAEPDNGQIRVDLPADLEEWTLALCLLATDLAKEVHISGSNALLVLMVDPRLKSADRGRAAYREQLVEITLSKTELETWQYFFLRAFRDGTAEVDHIDVELRGTGRGPPVIDLTLKVQQAKPPISGADAARILLGENEAR